MESKVSAREDEEKHASSVPIVVNSRSGGKGRKQTFVSGNHLLNFEVTGSPTVGSYGASSSRRIHHKPRPGTSFTKERFIHANFRFVARRECVEDVRTFERSPDAVLDWNAIELVLVPAPGNQISCPICLDAPLAARLTKCGHYFCCPCILRYADTASPSSAGNWRKCPICFESINTRQLKSVAFMTVEDYSVSSPEISEIGIPMILLQAKTGYTHVQPMETMDRDGARSPRHFGDLSPFDKITFVGRSFILNCVIDTEVSELSRRLSEIAEGERRSNEEDADKRYFELALTMVEDRRAALVAESSPSPGRVSQGRGEEGESPPTLLYFHQALDGQPYFLCPLTIKILRREFGSYDCFPRFLCAPVVEIELYLMTEELRKRHRYLQHIPIGCQLGLCELDLSSVVSSDTLREFSTEIAARASTRRTKAAREARIAAAALQREEARQVSTQLLPLEWDSRCSSPRPGVASAILGVSFKDDYENFPLPQSLLTRDEPIDIPRESQASTQSKVPLSGSFASIAAGSPPLADISDGLFRFDTVAPTSGPASSSLLNMSSLEDLSSVTASPSPDSGPAGEKGKKSKRIVLVSNMPRRRI